LVPDQKTFVLSKNVKIIILIFTIFFLILILGFGCSCISLIREQQNQINSLVSQVNNMSQTIQIFNEQALEMTIQQQLIQQNYTIYNEKLTNIIALQGIPGLQGLQGKDGAPGLQGKDGAPGPSGENAEMPIGSIVFHGAMNGDITSVSGNSIWIPCDGRPLLKSSYPQLFSLLGTTFGGGDGVYSFNIPDLRGRTTLGSGQQPGLSNRNLGDTGGSENVILELPQIPSHVHQQGGWSMDSKYGGGDYIRNGNYVWDSSGFSVYVGQSTSTIGEDQPHENMMPFLSLYAMIRIAWD